MTPIASQRYVDDAADLIHLSDELRETLSIPQRELTVQVPLTLDDGSHRMPPIGTVVVHEDAIEVLGEWIESLTDCP